MMKMIEIILLVGRWCSFVLVNWSLCTESFGECAEHCLNKESITCGMHVVPPVVTIFETFKISEKIKELCPARKKHIFCSHSSTSFFIVCVCKSSMPGCFLEHFQSSGWSQPVQYT